MIAMCEGMDPEDIIRDCSSLSSSVWSMSVSDKGLSAIFVKLFIALYIRVYIDGFQANFDITVITHFA